MTTGDGARSTMTSANQTPRPHVLLSVATSIDGYIDDVGPDRLLLSNEADFDRVDGVRAGCDAILLGAGAIRSDDPRVVVRSADRRQARVAEGRREHPIKVAVTGSGQLTGELRWFHSGGDKVVYTTDEGAEVLRARVGALADIVSLGSTIEIAALLADLGNRGVERLMVEGGEQIHTGFLTAGHVDEIQLAVTPLLVGDGPRFVGRSRFPWPAATRFSLRESVTLGDVVVLTYRIDLEEAGDRYWLGRAIELAERCPPSNTAFSVGAVIVGADGAELSTGYSRETDDQVHAEEAALAKLGTDPALATATIYSSLEPCAERASRPTPCARLIIASGIRRVVMAWSEPNDYVDAPDGMGLLREAGVEVVQLPVDVEPNYRR